VCYLKRYSFKYWSRFLDAKLLCTVSKVCKLWYELSQFNKIWFSLCKQKNIGTLEIISYKIDKRIIQNWKQAYIHYATSNMFNCLPKKGFELDSLREVEIACHLIKILILSEQNRQTFLPKSKLIITPACLMYCYTLTYNISAKTPDKTDDEVTSAKVGLENLLLQIYDNFNEDLSKTFTFTFNESNPSNLLRSFVKAYKAFEIFATNVGCIFKGVYSSKDRNAEAVALFRLKFVEPNLPDLHRSAQRVIATNTSEKYLIKCYTLLQNTFSENVDWYSGSVFPNPPTNNPLPSITVICTTGDRVVLPPEIVGLSKVLTRVIKTAARLEKLS